MENFEQQQFEQQQFEQQQMQQQQMQQQQMQQQQMQQQQMQQQIYQAEQPSSYSAQPYSKKKRSLWGKVFLASLLGVCFGIFASGIIIISLSVSDVFENTTNASDDQTSISENEDNSSAQDLQTLVTGGDIEVLETPEPEINSLTDVTEVVESVMPSVVIITNLYTEEYMYNGYITYDEYEAGGSGIIIGENTLENELLIVTNYHVIEDYDELHITFIDGKEARAEVKGMDKERDLAIVVVYLSELDEDTKDTIGIAKMGNSDNLQVGEPAIAIGNALGYGQSVTVGVISAINRQLEDTQGTLIQTDAAINPGNSGGALLNMYGEVIGINTLKLDGEAVEGMGYAIPISDAEPILQDLMNMVVRTKVPYENRGYIGITGSTSHGKDTPRGVYVEEVQENTGAFAAGIEIGDIITYISGNEVVTLEALLDEMEYHEVEEDVSVVIMRLEQEEYKEISISVNLGERPIE